MPRVPQSHNNTTPVEKFDNTAYDAVELVAENIEEVIAAAGGVDVMNLYLGAFENAPTEGRDGAPLVAGNFYLNETDGNLQYYDADPGVWVVSDADTVVQAAQQAQDARDSALTAMSDSQDARDAAQASQVAAATSEANAATSESNASTSEANANTSANNAANSETAAALSEINAGNSELAAAASEAAAGTSETNASTSAASASAFADSSALSASAADVVLTNFESKYLGAKTSPPLLDNTGQPLQIGATYWQDFGGNQGELRYWDGNDWGAIVASNSLVTPTDRLTARTLANHFADFVNIKDFGAVGDGIVDDTAAIQAAIDFVIAQGGGRVYIPSADVYYKVTTQDENKACLWVHGNNVTISGDGYKSIIKTEANAHIPLHFSSQESIATPAVGTELRNFEVYGIVIQGTGVYQNFGLAKGRGILFRNVINVNVHDNQVYDMSMIGICAESGDGYFKVVNNQVHDCKYTGINFNGRCYQSIISGNIVSGCNGDINSLAIQATGHCIITSNTVYGDVISNAANCGGIAWGEGNYDGHGVIANNLVKNVSWGIQAIYHGACNITGNTVINATNRGGIILSSTNTPSFTVANSDNICANNLLLNCAPYGITCSAEDTSLNGNVIRTYTPITNPSALTEPDFVSGVITEQGIRIRGSRCSVRGNTISGCTFGLSTTITQKNGIIQGNEFKGNTNDYALESETPGIFAVTDHAILEREVSSPERYRERIFRDTLPDQGYFNAGSRWDDPTPAIGVPIGYICLFDEDTSIVSAQANAGDSVVIVTNPGGWLGTGFGSICGFEMDNGTWHWTQLTSKSGNDLTITTPVPAGRFIPVNAKTTYSHWRALPNLA
ncbi:tail fiber protein [Vibrio virus vB_VspP_SBP1]|uniref:Tail fiber protein n=1 Tax=Vibrio virus vB_VspP_SBP1 TaxID=2500581 RepID=A0A3T0IIR4_9CAUD|nr:tail fiber protein [Vibrio virus vB_VspP_SBP1]AZU99659.1 tail fiber protein [Vibrio virus vB_VspP_SBP1]